MNDFYEENYKIFTLAKGSNCESHVKNAQRQHYSGVSDIHQHLKK